MVLVGRGFVLPHLPKLNPQLFYQLLQYATLSLDLRDNGGMRPCVQRPARRHAWQLRRLPFELLRFEPRPFRYSGAVAVYGILCRGPCEVSHGIFRRVLSPARAPQVGLESRHQHPNLLLVKFTLARLRCHEITQLANLG